MDNTNYWPYTNIHELNLDWIIAKVKELDTRFTSDIETFVREYIDEHFAEWTVNANYDPDDETIIYTNGTGATLTAGDVIRFAIDNAYVNVKDPTARTAASNAATAAATAQSTADSAVTAAAAAQDTADDASADIITINNKLAYTRLGPVTGNTPLTITESWTEAVLNIYSTGGLYDYTIEVYHDPLVTNRYIRNGFYISSSDNGGVVVHLLNNTFNIENFYYSNTNHIDQASMIIDYR